MRIDQIPDQPLKLQNFIMSLKDGATFTIPQMRKATGVSWHTCDHFIQKWPLRFRPSIIGRTKGLGRPFVYKLLSNEPDQKKILEFQEMFTEGEVKEYKKPLTVDKKLEIMKTLFPTGIKIERYLDVLVMLELCEKIS